MRRGMSALYDDKPVIQYRSRVPNRPETGRKRSEIGSGGRGNGTV